MKCRTLFLITSLIWPVTLAQGASWQAEIPFRLVHGFGIVVQGRIGATNNLNFLFDTGAVPSAVSRGVASQIGARGKLGALAFLHDHAQAQYVTVGDVHFGPIGVPSLAMVVVDLDRLEKILGVRIDALIGLDVLMHQSFGIDYKCGKIVLGLEKPAQHFAAAEVYPFAGAFYWVLTVGINGREFRVLIDTGADGLALFSRGVPTSLLNGNRTTALAADLASEMTIQTLQPQIVAIGDVQFEKQAVVVLPDPPTEFQQLDGVIGPSALGFTRIEFDWENKCLRWDRE